MPHPSFPTEVGYRRAGRERHVGQGMVDVRFRGTDSDKGDRVRTCRASWLEFCRGSMWEGVGEEEGKNAVAVGDRFSPRPQSSEKILPPVEVG